VGMFEEFMDAISQLEVPVIAGLIPLRSLSMAEFMNKNISGISVPEEIMFRMKEASDPVEEGLTIASETIKELTKFSRGVHIMPIGSHKNTPKLLSMSGLSGK
jgi:methylenetetrahydrofolate reductase (NADPH)